MAASRKKRPSRAEALRLSEEGRKKSRDAFRDRFASMAWQPALRMASNSAGAPARCPRRMCSLSGECHLSTELPLACGGGLQDDTQERAADMVAFAYIMVQQLMRQFVRELPQIADGICKFIDDLDPKARQEIGNALTEAESMDGGR